jgi:hypothetical protein
METVLIDFVNIFKGEEDINNTKNLNKNAKDVLNDIYNSRLKDICINSNQDFKLLRNDFKTNTSNENNQIEVISGEECNSIKREKKKITLPYKVILEDGNTRINKNNRSIDKTGRESSCFFSLSPGRISILEENKIVHKKTEFKDVFKKYKLNTKNERINVRENLKVTDKLVKNYETNIKTPRVKSHVPRITQTNMPLNVLMETNSHLYIKINRNNFGPKLDLRNNKKNEKVGTPSFYNNIFSSRRDKK